MRFLANENVPLPSIRRLREAGHDVAAVFEDSPGVSDREVLARAALEHRVIATFDPDYGALVYQNGLPPPAGVIYFRFMPRSPEEPANRLLALMAAPALILEGRFTVLEPGQARQRTLL
jgi:predicted nuclease of predicted toxin-antitoxin system